MIAFYAAVADTLDTEKFDSEASPVIALENMQGKWKVSNDFLAWLSEDGPFSKGTDFYEVRVRNSD